jgi:hypothetical protein
MAKKSKIANKEAYQKTLNLKGSVRSTVAYDAIHKCKASTQVDRKRQLKAGGKVKHKGRIFAL